MNNLIGAVLSLRWGISLIQIILCYLHSSQKMNNNINTQYPRIDSISENGYKLQCVLS